MGPAAGSATTPGTHSLLPSMRIVFLGTGEIGVPSLHALAAAHDIAAVFTQPDRPAGRHLTLRPSPVKIAAQALGLPVHQPAKIRDHDGLDLLRALQPDLIVVIAYGQILPRSILELPPRGCLNVHASLLPRHRGASPIQAAILAGDPDSGVTIMQMDAGLDTGPMLARAVIPLAPDETGGTLHDRLAQLAPAPLLETLAQLDHLRPEPQDNTLATYAGKITREAALLDWTQPAVELDRRIRAYTPWPVAATTFPWEGQSVPLKIHKASLVPDRQGNPGAILETSDQGILVAAGEAALLLREVQAPGAKRLPAAAFLRGRPLPVGEILG